MKQFSLLAIVFLMACAAGRPQAKKAVSPTPPPAMDELVTRIHFAVGSTTIDLREMSALDRNVKWLAANSEDVVVLEGHCDERGGDQLNLQLGDARARQVKAYLIAGGVDPDRLIMVVSHGKRRPLDPGHTEDAWRANRRVEFLVR